MWKTVVIAVVLFALVIGCSNRKSGESQSEDTLEACHDGVDNDLDGLVDCDDPECPGIVPCFDGVQDTDTDADTDVDTDSDMDLDTDTNIDSDIDTNTGLDTGGKTDSGSNSDTDTESGTSGDTEEPFFIGGDSSLTWEWKIGEDAFTIEDCREWGIDYVTLWVWNDAAQDWWYDPVNYKAPCDAMNHLNDDAVWGDTVYSGLFIEDFLPAGQYEFLLGFYQEVDAAVGEADVLLFYDSAGPEEGEKDGVLQADEDLDAGTNHYVTVFEMAEEIKEIIGTFLKSSWIGFSRS